MKNDPEFDEASFDARMMEALEVDRCVKVCSCDVKMYSSNKDNIEELFPAHTDFASNYKSLLESAGKVFDAAKAQLHAHSNDALSKLFALLKTTEGGMDDGSNWAVDLPKKGTWKKFSEYVHGKLGDSVVCADLDTRIDECFKAFGE